MSGVKVWVSSDVEFDAAGRGRVAAKPETTRSPFFNSTAVGKVRLSPALMKMLGVDWQWRP